MDDGVADLLLAVFWFLPEILNVKVKKKEVEE